MSKTEPGVNHGFVSSSVIIAWPLLGGLLPDSRWCVTSGSFVSHPSLFCSVHPCLPCLSFPNSHGTEFSSDASRHLESLPLHSSSEWWKGIGTRDTSSTSHLQITSKSKSRDRLAAWPSVFQFALLRAPWAPHSWVFRKSPTHFITCSSYLIQHPGYSPTVATSTSIGGKGGGLGHPRTSHINHRWRLIAGRLELASQLLSAFFPST